MKKKFLLILIVLTAIMMVGCVDADVTVDLEKDGTGKATIQVLGPKAVFDNIPQENIDEWGKNFETVEKIADSDKSGYKFNTRQDKLNEIFKEITNLDASFKENGLQNSNTQEDSSGTEKQNINNQNIDNQNLQESSDSVVYNNDSNSPVSVEKVSTTEESSTATNDESNNLANELYEKYVDINEEKSLFSSTYDVNLKLKDAIYSEMSLEQKALVQLIGQTANLGLHIKSPIEAEYSNATSVTTEDGKHVYNWEYTLSDVENISFSAKVPNIRNIVIVSVCAVAVVLGVVIVLVIRRKTA